jgi:hypothetical protein
MLLKILKATLSNPAPAEATEAGNHAPALYADAAERSIVLVTFGPSRSSPFKNMGAMLAEAYAGRGVQCHLLELTPGVPRDPRLAPVFLRDKIRYVIAWGGIGADVVMDIDGDNRNVWDHNKTPVFNLMGDHPAYFLDLHTNPYSSFVNVYGYTEHRDFFMRHTKPGGYGAVSPLLPIDPLPPSALDFKAKESGKIFFLKNGNDPQALQRRWRERLPASVAGMLLAMGETLVAQMPREREWSIEGVVVRHFADAGIDISTRTKFLAFYIAQLDDYLRRVKSRMIAETLLDLPVEIHGEFWEYLDFNGRRAKLVPFGDYARSKELIKEALAVVDMSPNTHSLPHERFVRCASRHTLCVTNRSALLERDFGPFGQPLFDFTPDSIRASVEAVLADPAGHVEIGRKVGAEYARRHPEGALLDFFEMMADQIGVQEGEDPQIQNFFVWPPGQLNR